MSEKDETFMFSEIESDLNEKVINEVLKELFGVE